MLITELLGPFQVPLTMQTYAHVLPETKKQVAVQNRLDSGFESGCYSVAAKRHFCTTAGHDKPHV